MTKVSRSMLKNIVKECLVELLAEGLSNNDDEKSLNESLGLSKNPNNDYKKPLSSKKIVNPKFEEKTKEIISNTTKDPVMASILEDTAKTTLQEQNGVDQPNKFSAKNYDVYSQAVKENDPMEIFSESSDKWANLAFSEK